MLNYLIGLHCISKSTKLLEYSDQGAKKGS